MFARRVLLAVIALITVAGLAACTSSGGGGSTSSAGDSAGGGTTGVVRGSAAGGSGYAPTNSSGGAASRARSSGPDGTRVTLSGAESVGAEITNITMSVQVLRSTTVDAKVTEAESIALRAGGEIDGENVTFGRDATALLILRVPPEALQTTLAALAKLGHSTARHRDTQDVTARVADVRSRVNSARTAIARLRLLYQNAGKIADVIELENELSQRESDLESLEAQQRALSAETSLATITFTLTTPPPLVHRKIVKHEHKKPAASGFLGGLQRGWHAFVTAASGFATFFGAVLPFLVLLLVLGLIARWAWPRLRVRIPRSPAGPPNPTS